MKIKELIQQLSKFNPEYDVLFCESHKIDKNMETPRQIDYCEEREEFDNSIVMFRVDTGW